MIKRKETRIKFSYLRKRHNLSPNHGDDNTKLVELIKERGSASMVAVEKVLPNIYHLGSIAEPEIEQLDGAFETNNSSLSRVSVPGSKQIYQT